MNLSHDNTYRLPRVVTLSGTRCPLPFRTLTPAAATVAPSAILTGSDPRPLSLPRTLAATFAPGDLRTLGDSHTLGIVWTLVNIALSPFVAHSATG